jgi:hypothetical protein
MPHERRGGNRVSEKGQPEVWMRGPVAGIPGHLQPVAHSLLQLVEEVLAISTAVTPRELWSTPGGAPSAGFHLRHAAGALDRLFTYARGEMLNDSQLAVLGGEGAQGSEPSPGELVARFGEQVERALEQLRTTREETVLDARRVGRARLPSTVIGLLFHAAEHTQRHIGQMTTTLRIVRGIRVAAD